MPENLEIDFNYKLARISSLRRQCQRVLGVSAENLLPQIVNLDPFFEIDNLSEARRRDPVSFADQMILSRQNIISGVNERLHVEKNKYTFRVVEGKIRSDTINPHEPFSKVLRRGVFVRSEYHSPDGGRELAELAGWEKVIEPALLEMMKPDSPEDKKIISLSPPSDKEGTPYSERFVDVMEVQKVNDLKQIVCHRYAVNFSQFDYQLFAENLSPNYFAGRKDESFDTWCLGHPIVTDKQLPDLNLEGLSAEVAENIVRGCWGIVNELLVLFGDEDLNWVKIAKTFNALLNRSDELEGEWRAGRTAKTYNGFYSREEIVRQINRLGVMPVIVRNAGCAGSAGFGSGRSSGRGGLENSVAMFGTGSDQYGSLEFTCESCHHKNLRPYGQLIPNCQHCHADVRCG